jgi:hypothetical protein
MNLIEQKRRAASGYINRLRTGLPWRVEQHRRDPLNAHVVDRFGNNVATNISRAVAEFMVERVNADSPDAQSNVTER